MLQKGEEIGEHDLSLAEPTFTHMALYELHKRDILKYVVSQNCDGLHLRSGLPRFSLSEVHGNMYVEVCKSCKPALEYWRLFDTTPLTSRFQHKTNRRCRICANPLVDTIVHFGERGSLKWPLNWSGASKAVEKADVILCLGSSLKVLKKYPWLWALDKPLKQRPKVYIVNLQWTPKDSIASIKINGKCDEVMEIVMKHLNIEVPEYDRFEDPIFQHASLLKEEELHTASQPMLKRVNEVEKDDEDFEESFNDQNDESTNSITLSSDKHTLSNESEDQSQSCESSQNFIGVIKRDSKISEELKKEDKVKENQLETVEKPVKADQQNGDIVIEEVKIKLETSGSIETTCENGKLISIKEDIKEVIDLTEQEAIKTNGHGKADEIIDFEELIDNLEVKVETVLKKEEPIEHKKDPPVKNEPVEVPKVTANPMNEKAVANIILQQNQNLIDMALLNNSLLTASLAFAPVGTTSKEALTATALILNYNNQIISTLTNNLNLLPYSNGLNNGNVLNGSSSVNPQVRPINCDKTNVRNELYENDIEMVEQSDEGASEETGDDTSSSLTAKQLSETPEQYYKQLFANYCKAINDNLPKWSDVNYAYSGLHTIVNLPPEDVNLWKSNGDELTEKKKLRSSTALERKAAKAECKFCYDKYQAMTCQFYPPINREFKITTYRNGRAIVCECCDYTDDEEDEQTGEDENLKLAAVDDKDKSIGTSVIRTTKAGWFGKGKS